MTGTVRQPRYTIQAVRLVYRDDQRGCDTLRTIGHRAQLGDEWRGPTRHSVADARLDILAHKLEQASRPEPGEVVQAHGETAA